MMGGNAFEDTREGSGLDRMMIRDNLGGCITTVHFVFAHFEDNLTHGYSLEVGSVVASRPGVSP